MHRTHATWTGILAGLVLAAGSAIAGTWTIRGMERTAPEGDNRVRYPCLAAYFGVDEFLPLKRRSRWSLPQQALAPDFDTTVRCLVLRFDFQYETVDDPNTTGRGRMNLSRPLDNPADSAAYFDSVGHWIDPPPHDSVYFDAHMRALDLYWSAVSDGRLRLTWDIFPPGRDSVYTLPQPMNAYGICSDDISDVIRGLEQYFLDCIHTADSAHIVDPAHPDIDFSQYDAIFLFHAGSDRQNDIGFPPTCSDLFTGFIRFGDSVAVDGGAYFVKTALMMPETASQDNRATALNAVMAHEFGHQLGLVDLYRTDNFMSQLGDFALMDNNGFGTGIDFGFPVGSVYGAVPVYPCAWSRAYLGFEDVVDVRNGTDLPVTAAAAPSTTDKVYRIPISETEYYLVEVRSEDIDGLPTNAQADSLSNVILGPARLIPDTANPGRFVIEQTGEYDFLLPGSGMLIYHVDEEVAGLDYDGDGLNNFLDNQVNWCDHSLRRKFIRLVEADGLVNFGGFYRSGYGKAEDMFREDRLDHFTPNSNPPAIDNSGNNTHVYVTNIHRDTIPGTKLVTDTLMRFDIETDKLASGFPVRAGAPVIALSPVVDDLNRDGRPEVVAVAGRRVIAVTPAGESFLQSVDPCPACPPALDTVVTSINRGTSDNPAAVYPVPVYVEAPSTITAGPVTGDFGDTTTGRLLAVGYQTGELVGQVALFAPADADNDGRADRVSAPLGTFGVPIALSFGKRLYVLTDRGNVYVQDSARNLPDALFSLGQQREWYGLCRLGDRRAVLLNRLDSATYFTVVADTLYEFSIDGVYEYGPVVVDLDRDGRPEVAAVSAEGVLVVVTIDTTDAVPSFSLKVSRDLGEPVRVNLVAGDVDDDGFADLVTGGGNFLYALNRDLTLLTDFPREVDDRWPQGGVMSVPLVADIDGDDRPDILTSTTMGNLYALDDDLATGFPLNNGQQVPGPSNSAPFVLRDSSGSYLGYLGGDGWLYLWAVSGDRRLDYWPMNGHDPEGTYALPTDVLPAPRTFSTRFPPERFYCYENPVTDGSTTIRYFLGEQARRVELRIFSLSGREVAVLQGPVDGGVDNEVTWNCSGVPPGVYRCRIEVDFGDGVSTAFTDVAVIR